uniref:C-type lectin domain-containing protein n=1 Tax=Panagrolaimus davidi TaxID=227884 RepID=A0A914QKR2_9BILA
MTPFSAAEVFCAEIGGHLVSIHDAFLNSILAEEAITYFHESTMSDFWIGLTNLMSLSKWQWIDGTPTDFTNWANSEPKNVTGSNCATLSQSDGLWRAEDCFKTKPFICKVDQSFFEPSKTTTKKPITTTSQSKQCPELWIYF